MPSSRSNNDVPVVNEDCVLYIAQCLATDGDFTTLARVMLASKTYFAVVAPVLYGSLFRPEFGDNMMENWSVVKKRKLAALLLVPSLFNNDQDDNVSQPLKEFYLRFSRFYATSSITTTTTTTSATTKRLYHTYLKFMDQHLFDILQDIANEMTPYFTFLDHKRNQFWQQFAPLMYQIDFQDSIPSKVITNMAHLFSRLSTIRYTDSLICSQDGMEKFIMDHAQHFPGQLESVFDFPTFPSKKFLEAIQPIHVTMNTTCLERMSIASPIFPGLKSIKVTGPSIHEVFGSVLEKCQVLETIRVVSKSFREKDHFEWAVEKRTAGKSKEDGVVVGGTVKKLIFEQGSMSSFKSCLDGFRESLEHVSFTLTNVARRGNEVTCLDWQWDLPNLTVLELSDMDVDLSCIESCPKLEVLKLYDIRDKKAKKTKSKDLWMAPSSLRVFHMIRGDSFFSFQFECLERMTKLETIFWSCMWKDSKFDTTLQRIDRLETMGWELNRLKDLELGGGALVCWQDLLPDMAPNLIRFSVAESGLERPELTKHLLMTLSQRENLEIVDLGAFRSLEDSVWVQTFLETLKRGSDTTTTADTASNNSNNGSHQSPFPSLGFVNLSTDCSFFLETNDQVEKVIQRPGMKQVWYHKSTSEGWNPRTEQGWEILDRNTLPPTMYFPLSVKDLIETDLMLPFPVVAIKDDYYDNASYMCRLAPSF